MPQTKPASILSIPTSPTPAEQDSAPATLRRAPATELSSRPVFGRGSNRISPPWCPPPRPPNTHSISGFLALHFPVAQGFILELSLLQAADPAVLHSVAAACSSRAVLAILRPCGHCCLQVRTLNGEFLNTLALAIVRSRMPRVSLKLNSARQRERELRLRRSLVSPCRSA